MSHSDYICHNAKLNRHAGIKIFSIVPKVFKGRHENEAINKSSGLISTKPSFSMIIQ